MASETKPTAQDEAARRSLEPRRSAAIRSRGNESGVADPTRGDAAGEQAQPPQHRDAAGKPADSSGARCTLCGASRIDEVAGTYGACGNLECRDPMHDYRKEHARPAPAPVAVAAASEREWLRAIANAGPSLQGLPMHPEADRRMAEWRAEQPRERRRSLSSESAAVAELRAEMERLRGEVQRKDVALRWIESRCAKERIATNLTWVDQLASVVMNSARAALAPATPESVAPSPIAAAQDELVSAARLALALLRKPRGGVHPMMITQTAERLQRAVDAVAPAAPESTRSEK